MFEPDNGGMVRLDEAESAWFGRKLGRNFMSEQATNQEPYSVSTADLRLRGARTSKTEGHHYLCRASCGGPVVLVDEAAESVAAVDRTDSRCC